MARSRNACVTPRAGARAWAVSLLLAAPGCTICPDPFDYSGPVPNRSAPQNDFRARSGGIAPLDGVPRPWPPVVRAAPGTDDPAPQAVVAAAEEPAAAEQATSGPDGAAIAVQAVAAEAAGDPVGDPSPDLPGAGEPALDDILPPAPPPRSEVAPRLRETPGWKSRG